MDYTTLVLESKADQEQPPKRMHSLYEVCKQVGDGRDAHGKRYELAGLLVVLVLAKLAGMQNLLGASDWIADQGALLREGLQLSWKRMPCANTYSYALARLNSQQVNAALASWFERKEAESRCGQEPSRLVRQPSEWHVHLAIDGKALKGTGKQRYGGEDPQEQVLHVYEVQTGIVVQQCPIAAEHNEVSTLKPLLSEVLCKGRILTADAAQSYHDFGRLVMRAGGDVVLFIKDKHNVDVRYGWTSLSHTRCSPQRLLALTRAHWAVENRLHWRRDVTDGVRMRVASACHPWLTCWPCLTPWSSP